MAPGRQNPVCCASEWIHEIQVCSARCLILRSVGHENIRRSLLIVWWWHRIIVHTLRVLEAVFSADIRKGT